MKPGGVWMLEEATGLLREIPARSWTMWLAGTLPFTLLLIDFLMDMMRSAFSAEGIVSRSLVLTALFVAKHIAQGMFSRNCLQVLRGDSPDLPRASAVARLALVQAAWQPLRWPVLTIASIAVIPFPWVVAFLQQIGLSAVERERGFVRESWQLARAGTRADSVALLILTLCWLLLFVNLFVLWLFVPMLLKSFFGWQTEFGLLAARMMNATTFTVTVILTFAVMEPLFAAQAAVRAFYAQALRGGEDLRGALRRMAAGLLVGALLMSGAAPLTAQEKPIDKAALDKRIDEVLRDSEFSWKMPKQEGDKSDSQWLRGFFETIARWMQWLYDFYKKLFPDDPPNLETGNSRWSVNAQLLRWAMIGAAVLAAGCVVLILLTRRKEAKRKKTAEPVVVPAIDLEDDSVSAGQLVEDEWLRMADQYASGGDFRLAMRAVHLAGLRYLGEKGLVTLQPAKTGMEYGRELARRLRDVPAALSGYGSGLRQYEVVWYGFGAAQADTYRSLRTTWEEMRRNA
ncbi:MAG: DUF4129 domain-containing protein [Acidobacteria bacterium]|nr:DUF4129 domain-containing protein [Acidobacteriota bacterium]